VVANVFLEAHSRLVPWSVDLLDSSGALTGQKSFEGTVTVTETGGKVATPFLFTRKGDQVRVEHVDTSKPEPVNIVDLATHKLTIVYPHNSSFVQIDLMQAEAQPGAPSLPSGFPIPPTRSMPLPDPAIGGPPVPAQGGFGGAPELKKTDQKKKIQGFDCTLYTIGDRMDTFEIWATSATALFPFYPLHANYRGQHFGPQMLDEQWIRLLQKQSLFPLEARLKLEHGGAGALFLPGGPDRGEKIENDARFKPPEDYQEIHAPQF
jgi:hypothetical protein